MRNQAVPDITGLYHERLLGRQYSVIWDRNVRMWYVAMITVPYGEVGMFMPEQMDENMQKWEWEKIDVKDTEKAPQGLPSEDYTRGM